MDNEQDSPGLKNTGGASALPKLNQQRKNLFGGSPTKMSKTMTKPKMSLTHSKNNDKKENSGLVSPTSIQM